MNPALVPTSISTMPDSVFALTLALLMLAPLALAGVALINTGLGRSRSAAQALLGSLAILAVSVLVFALVGGALAGNLPGTAGGAGFAFQLAGKSWNWIGAAPLLLGGLGSAPPQAQLALLF
jgi:ammonia channel protein AmtB